MLYPVLVHHLRYDHFPPIDLSFIPVAEAAIEAAQADDWDQTITMPNDVTLTVREIVDGLHLDFFIDTDDD